MGLCLRANYVQKLGVTKIVLLKDTNKKDKYKNEILF